MTNPAAQTPGPDHAGDLPLTTAAKAYVGAGVAIIGSGITAAVGLTQAESPWFVPLVIASAMLTTAGTFVGVYVTPNKPKA